MNDNNNADAPTDFAADQDDTIFPLPLVAFERYQLADDRRAYPMTNVALAELEGTADRAAMDAAFAEALARHPLLTARIQRRWLRQRWVAANGPLPTLRWHPAPTSPELPSPRRLDVRRGAGIEGHVYLGGNQTTIVLHVQHAASDGLGVARFYGDLLACYGRRTALQGQLPILLPIQAANLRYRGMFDVRLPAPVPPWAVFKSTMREGWKVLSRRPLCLLNNRRPRGKVRTVRSVTCVEHLSPAIYGRLCERAAEQGATVNDLLLRDIFLTARAWNKQQEGRSRRGWLRIAMPTSLRGRRDSRMPATNVLGYALLTYHTDDCDDPSRLLADITADTQAIRAWSMGALFVEAMRWADRVPGLLWVGARVFRRFATLVHSNVGDPSKRFRARFPRHNGEIQAGNLTLKRMSGVVPIRPGTRVAVLLGSYADRLAINLHADPRWFSQQDAAAFLALYQRQLQESAHAATAPEHG